MKLISKSNFKQMKNKILILLISCFFSISSLAQIVSGEITYKVFIDREVWESRINMVNEEVYKQGLRRMFRIQINAVPHLEYFLKFNQEESLFYSEEAMGSDSGIDLETARNNTGVYGTYYHNLKQDITYHNVRVLGNDITNTHKISNFKWRISPETKNIQGYTCYKATTEFKPDFGMKDKMTVWFTTEIPLQFGPAFYAGLPGLILELQQGPYTFYAEKIKFSEKDKRIRQPKINKFTYTIESWEKEFKNMRSGFIQAY